MENTICFPDDLSLVMGQSVEQRVNAAVEEPPLHPTSSQRPGKGDSDWKQIKFLVPFNRKLEKRSKGLMAW